jgi:hypothetical protein
MCRVNILPVCQPFLQCFLILEKRICFFQIVFPNGSIDPWHALGITSDVTSEEQAIFIEGTRARTSVLNAHLHYVVIF